MNNLGARTLAGQLAGGVLKLYNPTADGLSVCLDATVSPNLQSLRLVHNASKKVVLDQEGDTVGLIFTDSHLECTFDFIPQAATLANAKLSASMPEAGGWAQITGLPIIKKGFFADALNTNGTNTHPWIYEGGSDLTLPSDDRATGSITLSRYPKITATTPYVA